MPTFQLSFWARGAKGGETVTFEFGLLGKDKKHALAAAGTTTSSTPSTPSGATSSTDSGGSIITDAIRGDLLKALLYVGLLFGGATVAGVGIYHMANSTSAGQAAIEHGKGAAKKAAETAAVAPK